MAVTVAEALAGEVELCDHARLQIRVHRHAGVDDGNANAAAGEATGVAITRPDLIRPNRGRDRVGGAAHVEVERDVGDAGLGGQLVHVRGRDFNGRNLCRQLAAHLAMARFRARVASRVSGDDERDTAAGGRLIADRRRDGRLR